MAHVPSGYLSCRFDCLDNSGHCLHRLRPGCVTPLRSATEMQQCVGWRCGDLVSGCVIAYMSVEYVFGDLGSDNQIDNRMYTPPFN